MNTKLWSWLMCIAMACAIACPWCALAEDAAATGLSQEDMRLEAQRSGDERESRTVAPPVLAGAVNPETYRIGPGDLLELQLWGKVTRVFPLAVGPEGNILLPGAGSVRLDGLTLAAARTLVLERVRGEFRDVRMDLRLARARTFQAYLTGEVLHPGPVLAMGSARVGDILTPEALTPAASHRHIDVAHRDGTHETADLELFLRGGDASRNPFLRDGDIVHVPTAIEFVTAYGALASPGRFELGANDSLSTLVRLAGGLVPAAIAERALWLRWSNSTVPESAWVNVADVLRGVSDQPLADSDRLYVYFVPNYRQQFEVTILGEVQRPGAFPIREGETRLSEVVAEAGGFLPTADLSAIRLHRMDGSTEEKDPELDRLLRLSRNELTNSEYEGLRTKLASKREDYRLDWNIIQREGQSVDLLMRDRDVIRVERLVSAIRVDGEVRRPAILSYRPGLSADQYVSQAGGFTDRAWRGKVRVTRAVTGQTLLARNIRSLGPGDFVWVPEKPDVTVWQQSRDVITALASIATVVIAIRSLR